MKTVARIAALIHEAAELQRPFVERLCGRCASPCCLRVHYLYDAGDIRFMTLAGIRRQWKGSAFSRKGCWFLGETGCGLEPLARPLFCHSYLCPELRAAMADADPSLLPALESLFSAIREWRKSLDR